MYPKDSESIIGTLRCSAETFGVRVLYKYEATFDSWWNSVISLGFEEESGYNDRFKYAYYCIACAPGTYNAEEDVVVRPGPLGAKVETLSTCKPFPVGVRVGEPSNAVTCDFFDREYAYSSGIRRAACAAKATACKTPFFFLNCPELNDVSVPVAQLDAGRLAGETSCAPGHFGVRVSYSAWGWAGGPGVYSRDYCIKCAPGTYNPSPTNFTAAPLPSSVDGVTQFSTCSSCPESLGINPTTDPETGATSASQCIAGPLFPQPPALSSKGGKGAATLSASLRNSGGAARTACTLAAALCAIAAASIARW